MPIFGSVLLKNQSSVTEASTTDGTPGGILARLQSHSMIKGAPREELEWLIAHSRNRRQETGNLECMDLAAIVFHKGPVGLGKKAIVRNGGDDLLADLGREHLADCDDHCWQIVVRINYAITRTS